MSDRIGENYNRYSKTNYTEYNTKNFDQNNLKNVYDEKSNKAYSLSQEPDIVYKEIEHYISISSRDRNRINYPNVNNYLVTFPVEFKNTHDVIQQVSYISTSTWALHTAFAGWNIVFLPYSPILHCFALFGCSYTHCIYFHTYTYMRFY